MPFLHDLSDLPEQHIELGGFFLTAGGIQEPWMAGGLAQAQEGFEHLDLGTGESHLLDVFRERGLIVTAELFVELALGALENAKDRLLALGREIPKHLLLRAPEDERAQCRSDGGGLHQR